MGDLVVTHDPRTDLALRTIPTMTFSTATSPLTAPLAPQPSTLSTTGRAAARFACPGNAVITGGAGTLALASARALLEHGTSQVMLLDLTATLKASESAIRALATDFPSARVHQYPVDVTSENAVSVAFTCAYAVMGEINMLLCFAGIVDCVNSIDVSAPTFRKVLDINLTGSFLCAQAAARLMMHDGGGSILFTASISALATNYPQPQAAYNVSKAGVLHLTKNLAAEWAVHGIRVNVISPGYMDTVLNAGSNLQTVREIWASRCPMGRMGDVEEIAGPVVMLISPRAGRYITGANVVVDGGSMCF